MLPDGKLAISLAYRQQAAVRGDAQGEHWTRVLGGMGHLKSVQVIHLCAEGKPDFDYKGTPYIKLRCIAGLLGLG